MAHACIGVFEIARYMYNIIIVTDRMLPMYYIYISARVQCACAVQSLWLIEINTK